MSHFSTFLASVGALVLSISPAFAANDLATKLRVGAAIYTDTCRACHGPDGKGVDGLIPRLAGSRIVTDEKLAAVVLVLQGGKLPPTPDNPTSPAMPSLGWRLNDQEIADVLTYVRNTWGNHSAPVFADEVRQLRQ